MAKKKLEELEWDKELGIIVKWFLITGGIGGFLIWADVPAPYTVLLTIVGVLLIVIYVQYKKIKTMRGKK